MITHAALAAGAVMSAGVDANAPLVRYRLTPEIAAAGATLAVEVSLRAGATGRTVVDLPDHGMGQRDRWRFLSDLEVQGAAVGPDGPAKRILTSPPGAPITIRYRVRLVCAAAPNGGDGIYRLAYALPDPKP